jgi:hypothetical protein
MGNLQSQLQAAGYESSKRKRLRGYNPRQPETNPSASSHSTIITNPRPGNEEILTRWLTESLASPRPVQSKSIQIKQPVSGIPAGTVSGMTIGKIGDCFWQASVSLSGAVCRGVAPTRDEAIARCRSLLTGARPKPPFEIEVHKGDNNGN